MRITGGGLAERMHMVEVQDGCWVWTGSKNSDGYGRIHGTHYDVLAHRLSYEENIGPIPPGTHVLHRCDNPPCVRPDHLFLGTDKDNVDDMVSKGRASWQRITHCPHDHEYTPENTRFKRQKGGVARVCHTCQREQARRYRANKRPMPTP